jgi:hypothetical protein
MSQSLSRASQKVRLPEFMGIGPPRTGTTWLHNVLEGHVDLPYGVKETLYFTTFYDKGFDWYARHFRYATGARKVGEICPYFFDTEAIERIKPLMPNCKFVVTMRDPVDRLYSMYKALRYSAEARRGTFEQALNAWPSMAKGNRYASNLKNWYDNFGRENVLVTMYEELRTDQQRYVNRVTDFIGIERISLAARGQIRDDVNGFKRAPRNRRLARRAWKFKYWLKGRQAYGLVNLLERGGVWEYCAGRGEVHPPLTAEQDARLRERYRPEVEALEEMLKVDLSAWKKPRAPRNVENPSSPRPQMIVNG